MVFIRGEIYSRKMTISLLYIFSIEKDLILYREIERFHNTPLKKYASLEKYVAHKAAIDIADY